MIAISSIWYGTPLLSTKPGDGRLPRGFRLGRFAEGGGEQRPFQEGTGEHNSQKSTG
jgi:hypothetical protein